MADSISDKFKDLIKSLKQVTSTTIKDNENSNVVKFLKTSITTVENIVATMDKMLKNRNINVGDMYEKGKEKGKGYIEQGKSLLNKDKAKGLLSSMKGKALDITSKLSSVFKKENETGTSPPEEEKVEDSAVEKSKRRHADKEAKKNKDPAWQEKAKERSEKRKAEIAEEKKAVLEKANKAKGGGWLGKILKGIMAVGGFLLTGIKSALGFLGGFMVKGLGKFITGIVPGLAGSIARITSTLVGGGLKAAGGLAWTGVKAAAGAALPALKGAALMAGRAGLMLATGPVGWAVAIGTAAYAGYKLYKYFKRNDIADDIYGRLTRLRFMMYGYDDNKKEHYSKLADLDMIMKDLIQFKDYKVIINPINEEIKQKILNLFEVNPEDKDKYKILTNWFSKRYLPSLRAYVQALYSVNSAIYIDDLDKLNNGEIFSIMSKLLLPNQIYNVTEAPFFSSPAITVTQNQVDELKNAITSETKDLSASGKTNTAVAVSSAVVMSKDNFAQNKLSKLASSIEKSNNIFVKVLKWSPIGMIGLAYVKGYSSLIKSLDIYSQLTKLRFMMYGYDDSLDDHYDKLTTLEMNIKKYIVYKDGKVTLKDIPTNDLENYATLFGVGREQKNDMEIFSEWLNQRFAPTYVAYMQALYSVNDKVYLDTINKLKYSEVVDFISKLIIPPEIYKIKMLPTSDYKNTPVSSSDVESLKESILSYAKKLAFAGKVKDKAMEIGGKIKDKISDAAAWVGDKAAAAGSWIKDKLMKAGSLIKENVIDPVISAISNIAKFGIMVFTSNFEGEKIIKLLNIPLMNSLIRLRYMMYGLDSTKKEHYIKMANIEMLMTNYIDFKNNTVNVKQLDIVAKTKIFDILEIKKDDDNKYKILDNWFNNRFLPAYSSYMKALYSVSSSVTLDTLNRLKPADVYNMLTKLTIPGSIYNVTTMPLFPDSKIIVIQDEIDNLKASIINEVKDTVEKEKVKAEQAKTEQPAQTSNRPKPFSKEPVSKEPVKDSGNIGKSMGGGEDGDGAKEPAGAQPTKTLESKVGAKLNKATGEIHPGSMSLEGITTKLAKEKIFNLDPNVRELFTGMAKEYNTLTGKSIPVNEAFRSYADQEALYKAHPGKAAKPGNSTHEFGLAVDINSDVANELDKLGLLRKYGFTRPIGGEKWHLEPIGVSLNPNMAKKDVNYRFKAITSSPGKGGDGYGTLSNSVMKKRDMAYQLSVYNKDGENTIDPSKALAKTNGTAVPDLTKSRSPSPGEKTGSTTTSGSTGAPTATTSPTAAPSTKPTISSSGQMPSSPESEGEKKPNIKQEKSALDTNNPAVGNNTNTDISKYATLGPEEAIKQAAKMTGMSEQTMLAYAKMESSLKGGNIKNKNSSATGLFQIVGGTWDALVKKYGPKYGLPADAKPDNNYYNALMAMEYAKENLAGLGDYKSAGIEESTAIYLAHHYGLSGAKKIIEFLKKDSNTPMKDAVSGAAYKANTAAIGDNTVGSYVQKISNKIGSATGTEYKATKTVANDTNSGGLIKTADYKQPASAPAAQSSVATQAYTPSQSPYKTVDAKPVEPIQNQQKQSMFDTKSIEGIMTSQLNTLTQIATILNNIDGKLDIDKLKALGSPNSAAPNAPIDKSIPKGSINLSRKKIET